MEQVSKNLISGLTPNDKRIELFAEPKTKKVFFIQNGKTKPFAYLNKVAKNNLMTMLLNDPIAMNDLRSLKLSEALEVFVLHCFGAADNSTDVFEDGEIGNVEMNTCDSGCMCFYWKSKRVEVNGTYLTVREMQLLQFFATDYPDKQIAMFLKISQSTLDSHKQNIMRKMHVHSKAGIVSAAMRRNLINL